MGTAEQMIKKLKQYAGYERDQYEWITAGGCCEQCEKLKTAGPYNVKEGLQGKAPIPGRDSHDDCRCTIEVHLD